MPPPAYQILGIFIAHDGRAGRHDLIVALELEGWVHERSAEAAGERAVWSATAGGANTGATQPSNRSACLAVLYERSDMSKQARGHWLIWGDCETSEFLTMMSRELAGEATQVLESMAVAHDQQDEEETSDPASEYPYYPGDDPRDVARAEAQLAMIRERDPDWTPPGSGSQGWTYLVTDATEDQVRARAGSLGAGVRGFLRVG